MGCGVRRACSRATLRRCSSFEGAVIVALAAVDHPLEAFELGGVGDEGLGGIAGLGFRMLGQVGAGRLFPENGFDAAHTAKAPFVVNEGTDE